MAFWKRGTKSKVVEPTGDQPASAPPVEQAVLIRIPSLLDPDAGLDTIEDQIVEAVSRSAVGEFDGNDVGPDGATLYLYGPDADAIWAAIDGALDRTAIGPGSHAILRYGPPGSPAARIDLAS